MKIFVSICAAILFSTTINSAVFGQDGDANRDIRIAERILDELFTDISSTNSGFPFGSDETVRGEYIPGVGLHFSVGENYFSKVTNMSGSIRIQEDDGPERSFTFDRQDNGERLSMNEIEGLLNEYITSYASQLRSVRDNEELRITFGLNTNTNRWASVFQSSDSDSLAESNSMISKSVSGRDLRRVREGNLSSDALLQRVETETIPFADQPRDVEIFSSILETAIQDIEMEGLRVNRTVRSNYIPGWGVRYYISVSTQGGGLFSLLRTNEREEIETELEFNFDEEIQDLREEEMDASKEEVTVMVDTLNLSSALSESMDSLAVALPKLMDSLKTAMPKMMEGMKAMFESAEVPGDEVIIADMEKLESEIKEIVSTYGPTLNSLNGNEYLMISINWRGRSSALPGRQLYYLSKNELLSGTDIQSVEL